MRKLALKWLGVTVVGLESGLDCMIAAGTATRGRRLVKQGNYNDLRKTMNS